MPLPQALKVAKERGCDLVQVAASTTPVVCRLLDYGRFKYQQAKKEREARKGQKATLMRQIRLRPKISEHDLDSKVRVIKRLLIEGNKVKVIMFLRGREASHPEIGGDILRRMLNQLKEVAIVDQAVAIEEHQMSLVFSPRRQPKEGMKTELGISNAKT
jgi:translation initiation factor IF-3